MYYKIAHRGASGYEPENTLRSFKKALDLGADMIEFDVHICKSGEVVIIHDAKVNRTTNGKGAVKRLTLEQLKQLDAGKGEKIPSLQEALDLINRKAKAVVELKGKGTAGPVAKILKEYVDKKGWEYSDFIVISFDHEQLYELKSIDVNFRIGLLFIKRPKGIRLFDRNGNKVDLIDLSFEYINFEFVKKMHEKGIEVFAYTVNEKSDILNLGNMGINAITSDYPDRL